MYFKGQVLKGACPFYFWEEKQTFPIGIISIDQTGIFTWLTEYKSKKSDSKNVFYQGMNRLEKL